MVRTTIRRSRASETRRPPLALRRDETQDVFRDDSCSGSRARVRAFAQGPRLGEREKTFSVSGPGMQVAPLLDLGDHREALSNPGGCLALGEPNERPGVSGIGFVVCLVHRLIFPFGCCIDVFCRHDSVSMSITWQCWTKRSTSSATQAAPGNTGPHCRNGSFVVITIERAS